ncbi:MAG: JmjC domain-containing protein [Gammaproteobacteria bacterium]
MSAEFDPEALSGLDPVGFLRDHWQRRPLYLNNAVDPSRLAFDGDDLAALACEAEIESRIVHTERDGRSWVLEHGPFDEERFGELPERDWTLLVQDVDKHVAAVRQLIGRFRFIPSWRIDDIMISFAADGGSVGPHWDDYDVFLIQAQGTRLWQLDSGVEPDAPCLEGTDLRILSDFKPTRSVTATPGDLLYLPPRVGHWGVAQGPCITWSVGFRAPSARSLLSGVCERTTEQPHADTRYADPGLEPAGAHPGLIRSSELARLRELVRNAADLPDEQLDRCLLEVISEVKAGMQPDPPEQALDLDGLIADGRGVALSPRARCVYIVHGDTLTVSMDGQSWELPSRSAELIDALLRGPLSPDELASRDLQRGTPGRAVLDQWLEDGWLEPDMEDESHNGPPDESA